MALLKLVFLRKQQVLGLEMKAARMFSNATSQAAQRLDRPYRYISPSKALGDYLVKQLPLAFGHRPLSLD
jgi:hypothetical protein